MRGVGKPKKSAFQRTQEKLVAIRELISNETDRHARKMRSLSAQMSAAQRFKSEDAKNLALVRLANQRIDEDARYAAKKKNLDARLQKALR